MITYVTFIREHPSWGGGGGGGIGAQEKILKQKSSHKRLARVGLQIKGIYL